MFCAHQEDCLGLDIPDVELVIQFGVPKSLTNWMQRAGRAARLHSMQGQAILLVEASVLRKVGVSVVVKEEPLSDGELVANRHFDNPPGQSGQGAAGSSQDREARVEEAGHRSCKVEEAGGGQTEEDARVIKTKSRDDTRAIQKKPRTSQKENVPLPGFSQFHAKLDTLVPQTPSPQTGPCLYTNWPVDRLPVHIADPSPFTPNDYNYTISYTAHSPFTPISLLIVTHNIYFIFLPTQ
ncbi:hypothetical protein SERLA73DRAFT_150192 [Serpula lacrymans var. lacrymans S7.3]|uniref:Helicase C-terminal domain-containing protein n=1 Tax=Serpula lacrymans var. lacrymans (strain S7.3) TaxID=936435 RepID=F8PLG0_SERL3|nr:hypothetical protein SERLA73DRAFT_150192 [Serpula lacrymans var. lacrymans S7.3]